MFFRKPKTVGGLPLDEALALLHEDPHRLMRHVEWEDRKRSTARKTLFLRIVLIPFAAAGWVAFFAHVGFKWGREAARAHSYRFVTGHEANILLKKDWEPL